MEKIIELLTYLSHFPEGTGDVSSQRENMKLKRENQQLIEENNLLKLKMEILFDMVRFLHLKCFSCCFSHRAIPISHEWHSSLHVVKTNALEICRSCASLKTMFVDFIFHFICSSLKQRPTVICKKTKLTIYETSLTRRNPGLRLRLFCR